MESRGEGGREVKAGAGPGSPGRRATEGGRRGWGQEMGGLLAPRNARGRDCCAPGGVHVVLEPGLPVAETSAGRSYQSGQMTFRLAEFPPFVSYFL